MTVSGVQQVLLHVKIMEVSRTKLRRLGFDFAKHQRQQLLHLAGERPDRLGHRRVDQPPAARRRSSSTSPTAPAAFFGVLDALRQDGLAKILAEPNLVAISGRPAHFRVGGQYLLSTQRRHHRAVGQLRRLRHDRRRGSPRPGQRPHPPGSPPRRQRNRPVVDRRRRPSLAEGPHGRDGRGDEGRANAGHRRSGAEPRRVAEQPACRGSAKSPISASPSATSTNRSTRWRP